MISTRAQLQLDAMVSGVPQHDIAGLVEYIFDGRPTGGFLEAVLTNDLKEAFGRADEENAFCMLNIVSFLYNYAPIACWGSPDRVREWKGIDNGAGKTPIKEG